MTDQSKGFLVVLKSKEGRLGWNYTFAPSLEDAKEAPRPDTQPAQEDQTATAEHPPVDPPAFQKLLVEIEQEISVFSSLHSTILYLQASRRPFNWFFVLKPVLTKNAFLEMELEDRAIYSFDLDNMRPIEKALDNAVSGIQATNQFPRLALIGLVGAYDVLLQKIVRTALRYEERPATGFERKFTLAELKQFATVSEIAEFVIDKEIESILREDHLDQLRQVEKLFSVQIDSKDKCVLNFLEICERRNLFTHNAGVVNTQYIKKCTDFGIDLSTVKVGDELRVSQTYYKAAVDTIHELCIKLSQFLWRKLVPAERQDADSMLNQAAYQLISDGQYSLAERILHYGLHHSTPSTDEMKKMMVVNYANAIKLGGDKERALKELRKVDWSACHVRFTISVAAVQDNIKEVAELIASAAKSESMTASDFRAWPVFHAMREKEEFQKAFKSVYGEELILVPRTTTQMDNVAASDDSGTETENPTQDLAQDSKD